MYLVLDVNIHDLCANINKSLIIPFYSVFSENPDQIKLRAWERSLAPRCSF